LPGENDMCDISTKKTANFHREKHISKKEKIIEPDNIVIDIDALKNSKKGWYNVDTKSKNSDDKLFNIGGNLSNKVIGIKCEDKCQDPLTKIGAEESKVLITNPVNKDKQISINNKPIIGVNVNYNKNTNKIAALQYLYDKNKAHDPKKHNVGIFGSEKDNINAATIGNYNNKSKGIEKLNFTCPPNAAIYKVEGAYDNNGLRGAKFHCQNIKTGKLVKSYDNNNKKVYGVNFGIEPRPDDENYHYDKSECSMYQNGTKFYPTFISNIGGDYDNKKQNIQNLRFNKCSFYNNK
jgi:hypothetical protein